METNIKNYNDMVYENRLVKFSDLISNKNNLVHKQLYNNALDKYINEWLICKRYVIEVELLENELKDIDDVEKENKLKKMKRFLNLHKSDKKFISGKYIYFANNIKEFKENCYILEMMNTEYWMPSYCKIITKFKTSQSPNLSWKVNLEPYWNNHQSNKGDYRKMIISKDEKLDDAKIVDINYVQGKAKIYSENLDKELEVDFDFLNVNNIGVDESIQLKNTFSSTNGLIQ